MKLKVVSRSLNHVWRQWQRFWFESNQPINVVLFRRILGVLLFIVYGVRTIDLEFFYTDHGMLPRELIPDLFQMGHRWSLLFYFSGTNAAWILNSLFLAALLGLAFGFYPRAMALISFVLHVSFLHRNPAIVYGVDLISTFFLFFLIFMSAHSRSIIGSVAYRLVQIQVCVIYFYSGVDKLKGAHWWKGDALWFVLTNDQISRFDFTWMSSFPLLIAIGTYSTLIWEIYFPILVWTRLRGWTLALGCLFHLGIAATMNIPYFSLLMITSYVLYLRPAYVRKIITYFKCINIIGFLPLRQTLKKV